MGYIASQIQKRNAVFAQIMGIANALYVEGDRTLEEIKAFFENIKVKDAPEMFFDDMAGYLLWAEISKQDYRLTMDAIKKDLYWIENDVQGISPMCFNFRHYLSGKAGIA